MSQRKQELQRILQLVDNVNRVKANTNNSSQELLTYYVKSVLGIEDIENQSKDDQEEICANAFTDIFDKLQVVTMELTNLQKSSSENRPQSAARNQPLSFNSMITAQKSIIRVQAWWRKVSTLQRIQKDIRDSRAAMSMKKEMESPEEGALREFAQQLQQKKITPESFYRICDHDYKQTITVAAFKDQIQKLGIQLSKGQLSRLILILDEDMEGNITREEYYNALEAYNVSGEKHKSLDGSIYHPFEHRCLFKLIGELRKKDISFLEMFNACDINDDTRVNINEIKRFAEGLSPDFQQKELHSLMNYLDIDKNGLLDKDEFTRQLNKGEQTFKQTQIVNRQIQERKQQTSMNNNYFQKSNNDDDMFESQDVGGGDQHFFSGVMDSVSSVFGGKKSGTTTTAPVKQDQPPKAQAKPTAAAQQKPVATQQLTPDQQKRKLLIEKMEKEGLNFQSFFNSLKGMLQGGLIPLGGLLKAMEASYPTITVADRNFLIKDCVAERGKLDYIQLEELFTKFSKNLKPSVSQTFSIIANNIIKRMGGSPQESIRQFFRAQNVSETEMLSDIEFTQMFQGKFSTLSTRELEQAFNSMNLDMDGFVQVRDLIEVLLSYTSGGDVNAVNVKELSNLIPGFETMSPRTRCEEVIDYILNELKKKNLKSLNVYKMADTKNTGGVQAIMLEINFKKILPHIKNEIFQEAFNAFKITSQRDIISRSDFETVFNDDPATKYIPHSGSVKKAPAPTDSLKVQPKQTDDEHVIWIKKLDNAMLREGISPGVAFKAADLNHNGIVTVDELRDSIKRLIPEDALSLVQLKKVMMAFDTNRNGSIEEQEFIGLFEKARGSTVTIIESPQKSRILQDTMTDDRRSKLPMKDQQTTNKTGTDTNSIALQVDTLDKKINLKKFFSDIPINEEGQMMVNHVGRRFKSEQGIDGTTFRPSDYLPVIKSLDPTGTGFIEVKDVLKFLEKYCKSNSMDCTLELKFMANFIEFKMKNRNTRLFFENSSKLKAGARLMEVELMSELQKIFGIPMEIGNLIFKKLQQLKGNIQFTLDDLCKMIDEHRMGKIDQSQVAQQTEAQKMDAQGLITRMQKGIQALPKKSQQLLAEKFMFVDQQQKQVPYKDFFEIFVEEYQLLNINESKSVFSLLKNQSTTNTVTLQQVLEILRYQQAKPNLNDSINDREVAAPQVDISAMVKQIEASIRLPIEKALEEFYQSEQVPSNSLQKKLHSLSQNLDQKLTLSFCQLLDKKTGKIQIKDLISHLKDVAGKYDAKQVILTLANGIDSPIAETLENQGITPNDTYVKIEFFDILSQYTSLSQFHLLCLFYELSAGTEQLLGSNLIKKLNEAKGGAKLDPKKSIKTAEEEKKNALNDSKKQVSFNEPVKDEQQVKIICNYFVTNFPRICVDAVIDSAFKKISSALKQFKTPADALSKFDSTGKGIINIDTLKAKLDDIRNLTNEEKFVITFVPINQNLKDITEVNMGPYIKFLRSLTLDQQIINQNKEILSINLEAVKKYLQPDQKPAQPVAKPISADKAEAKRQKKMVQMKDILAGLRNGFKDPKIKQQLIQMFANAPKQKLQYIELHTFFEDVLKIVADDAQYDIFNQQVDMLNKAKFKFNDFIDFCAKYEIDFKSDLAKTFTVAKSIKGERLTCGSLVYHLDPQTDYYKGIPTILNSEEAALVVAEKIYNSLKGDDEFFDKDFGPIDENDIQGSRKAIYCTGKPPPGYVDPEQLDWLRPEEITDQVPQFIDDGVGSNDVKQGKIGDCWFIGALSVIATRDELLRGGLGSIAWTPEFEADQETALAFSKGVYPPMFHLYRKKGIYIIRFFKEFSWRYVLIDDRLPCFKYSKKPVFGQCTNLHELWVPLIEKAYAKIHGCYESLISGFIDDALNDLTGLVAEKLQLHNEQKVFPHKSIGNKDLFWDFLMNRVKEGCMMGCSVVGDVEREIMIDGVKSGIMTGHAYGLIDAFELQDKNMMNPRKTHRILRVRNPWGTMEWKGKWGDYSEEKDKYKPLLDKYIAGIVDEDERFVVGQDDGTFLMNYASWRDIYNNMYICVDFPKDWTGIRYNSQWTAQCSGGVPSPMTEENKLRWAKNPQYMFQVTRDVEVFISLAQIDGRGKRPDGSYLKFPYTELIHQVLFTVQELAPGKDRADTFDKALVRATSVLKEHKEVSVRVKLPKGRYVIVPSTRNPGEFGQYFLSLYFSLPMKYANVKRIDLPDEEYEFIMEETETVESVPEWKVDLCQQRVKYMMLEEDVAINDSSSFINNSYQGQGSIKLSQVMNKAAAKKRPDSPKKEIEYDEAFPDDDVIE